MTSRTSLLWRHIEGGKARHALRSGTVPAGGWAASVCGIDQMASWWLADPEQLAQLPVCERCAAMLAPKETL